ncbi:RtcB family protein [archaeon]|mgnify:CR=1 FL=1|jgi:tRNA-splicing ligase RtcB (3'-phosphate/5'-hydroxy nucleic acid ligase)|nr:RtcB family protein [archaeon]
MEIKKIKENEYVIPIEEEMNVPGKVYASEDIMNAVKQDKTLEQVRNVAKLPGILKYSIALADAHQGYGFPIGGVAAFDMKKGVISPGGVGYDINCSVRLLKTNLVKKDIEENREKVLSGLARKIPSGVGRGSPFQITYTELEEVLKHGAKYIVEKGYGIKEDYLHMEEEGNIPGANPEFVSDRAKKRGIGQLGTLGAGNHFLDVLYVEEIFDEKVAKVFGLEKDQVVILIHCGSRGLGHQVASDYIKKMESANGIKNLPDRELVNAPINSKLGKEYFAAMACAANFAFANKQIITHWVREELEHYFPKVKVDVVYDVCHNIAKFEKYEIDGEMKKVCVHRKGATRSFGPGREEVPEDYREVGQPVLIPGSMGTASYVMVGTKKAEELTFGSSVHGAGRVMSRSQANRDFEGSDVKKDLKEKKILVSAGSAKALIEESSGSYKDIEEVVGVMHDLGISLKVAKLKPMLVVIG